MEYNNHHPHSKSLASGRRLQKPCPPSASSVFENPPPPRSLSYSQAHPPTTTSLRRAPSAPVRSRYRDGQGGHTRSVTADRLPPNFHLAAGADSDTDEQQQQQQQQHYAASPDAANDLARLSEVSGESLLPPHVFDQRPDSLAIFSSHTTLANTLSSHPHSHENLRTQAAQNAQAAPSAFRPSQPLRSQTTGRLSLRHTLSTRGLKRPSIVPIMEGAPPRPNNGSSAGTSTASNDPNSSPRQRYSDEIKHSKKKNGLSGFMAGLMKSSSRPAISAPANPLHVVHVGVDSTTGEFTVRVPSGRCFCSVDNAARLILKQKKRRRCAPQDKPLLPCKTNTDSYRRAYPGNGSTCLLAPASLSRSKRRTPKHFWKSSISTRRLTRGIPKMHTGTSLTKPVLKIRLRSTPPRSSRRPTPQHKAMVPS